MSHFEKLIAVSILSFLFGIILRSINFPLDYSLVSLVVVILLALAAIFFDKVKNKKTIGIYFVVVVVGLLSGLFRFDSVDNRGFGCDDFLGQKVTLTGQVTAEPSEREKQTMVKFKSDESNCRILVSVDRYPKLVYGDRIRITGKLERPENFETEAGRIFDYENYLARDGIRYKMSFAEAEVIDCGQGSWFKARLIKIKQAFVSKLQHLLPEPEVSLLNGLILGSSSGLGPEWTEIFRRAGLTHILVLSGYNMTVIINWTMRFLSFLPHTLGLVGGGISIILFTIMVGGEAAAVRAAIMSLCAVFALATGRLYDAARALIFSGLLMVTINPQLLAFDLGFQLSFLATAGMIYGVPIVERWFLWVPERLTLRELVTTSIAAQIFVLPWIIYKMGQASLVSLPAGLLVLPIVPSIMFLGFLTGAVGFISLTLAWIPAFGADLLLKFVLFSTKFWSAVPLILVPPLHLVIVAIIYILFFVVVYRDQRRPVKEGPL